MESSQEYYIRCKSCETEFKSEYRLDKKGRSKIPGPGFAVAYTKIEKNTYGKLSYKRDIIKGTYSRLRAGLFSGAFYRCTNCGKNRLYYLWELQNWPDFLTISAFAFAVFALFYH